MNLTFGNGVLLWGAALFVVPLIIHLLNRRRYRVVRWAAQDFLLQAFRRTRRRLRLESLLLLLLRCLLIAVLAFALARPSVPSSNPLALLTAQQRNVVIVLDTSYSMTRRTSDGTTCTERARAQAKRLLDGLSADRGDRVTLVTLGDPPQVRLAATTDIERVGKLIEESKAAWRGGDLIRTLDLLRTEVLGKEPGRHEVFLITDMQRVTFQPGQPGEPGERDTPAEAAAAARLTEAAPASALRQLVGEQDVELTIVDVGEDARPRNLTVEDLSPRPRNVVVGEVVTFTATVRNHSGRPQQGVRGTFVIDGRVDQGKQVVFDVSPEGVASVECSTVYSDPRPSGTVEFRLDADDLEADDARYLSFPVDASVKVLLVDGDYERDSELSETGRLAQLLNPYPDPEAGGTIFRLRTIEDRVFNLRSENLADYDLIVLANVARLDEGVAKDLDDAVRAGRGLLIFLGESVDARAWNERLHRADGSGLLPARLGDVKGALERGVEGFKPQVKNYDHPVLALFADPELQPSLAQPVHRYFETEITPKDTATSVTIHLSDDPADPDALVLEKPAGRGRVVLWTTTADDAWSDFGKSGNEFAFLPIVHETAAYLTLEDLSRFNVEVGQPLRKTTRSVPGEIVMTRPDGTRDTDFDAPTELEYGEYVLRPYARTALPGLYTLEMTYPLTGSGGVAGGRVAEQFAVNLDIAESDLSRIAEDAFPLLYPEVPVKIVREVGALAETRGEAREGGLWRALLYTVVALLAAEMLTAWWFGRTRRGA
jgi:hypothetical protein